MYLVLGTYFRTCMHPLLSCRRINGRYQNEKIYLDKERQSWQWKDSNLYPLALTTFRLLSLEGPGLNIRMVIRYLTEAIQFFTWETQEAQLN